MSRLPGCVFTAALLLASAHATAQTADRTEEEADMFGGSDPAPDKAAVAGKDAKKTGPQPTPTEPAPPSPKHDDFGDARMSRAAGERTDLLNADKLQIGGLMYMRNSLSLAENTAIQSQTLSLNTLTDVYLDATPNDRVRAFVRGRLLYTPVAQSASSGALFGMTSGSGPVSMVLNQLWIKTDIARRVFVTAGAQGVRWGATRLWNPVDVIYSSRRNPLTLFDQRVGVPMIKLHIPFEVNVFGDTQGWNAYFLALTERGSDLEHVGVAGRLEMVIATAEIGLSAVKRKGSDPRFGVDLSAGVWDFDITGELGTWLDAGNNLHWMASAGLQYGFKVNDDDTIYVGAEYFHNPAGFATADDAVSSITTAIASAVIAGNTNPSIPFNFFYMGQDYASLFAFAMGPGSWDDTNITVSVVSNLSDGTGISQLIIMQRVHTDLSLEFLAGLNFGEKGEFRFYQHALGPAAALAGQRFEKPLGQIGFNMRLSI